ncbi:phosphate ABC transporter substrate-binding protein [Mesoplasma photuris]|uniref:phosphate ABC transporter substrate-binding protein n=1 Tax=Mesoplasma photuris TaxID=217731 RepID=UPI00068B170E|nr:phosphate ABC transporter substrate-binding protein [Mesoplasma photuris]
MSKKIFLVIAIFLAAIIGLWMWTFVSPNNSISIGGSASVDPLMQRITNQYKKETGTSYIYGSTGSGSGINNVKNGVYDIGFISKEADSVAITGEEDNIIDDNQFIYDAKSSEEYIEKVNAFDSEPYGGDEAIHKVTFGLDSFVFIYNLKGTGFEAFAPYFTFELESLTEETTKNGEGQAPNYEKPRSLVEDSREILESIYEKDDQTDLITWHDLAEMIIEQEDDQETKKELQSHLGEVSNMKVVPYTTTPGSGTRSSFMKISGIEKIGRAVNTYANNGQIFSQINLSPGSLGYLSMGYAENVATMDNLNAVVIKDGDTNWDINDLEHLEETKNTYPLVRPFVALYKEKNIDKVADFLFNLATSKNYEEIFKEEGIRQILLTTDLENRKRDE